MEAAWETATCTIRGTCRFFSPAAERGESRAGAISATPKGRRSRTSTCPCCRRWACLPSGSATARAALPSCSRPSEMPRSCRLYRVARRVLGVLVAVQLSAGAAMAAVHIADAAKAGDRETVFALIDQKVDVNAPAADGATALHWAVYH